MAKHLPEFMRKILYAEVEGESSGLWAINKGHIYTIDSQDYSPNFSHVEWFEQLGLPSAGVGYDSILRGSYTKGPEGNTIWWHNIGPRAERQIDVYIPQLISYLKMDPANTLIEEIPNLNYFQRMGATHPVSLMRLTQVDDPMEITKTIPEDQLWVEKKFDGWLCQVIISGDIKLYSRRGQDITEKFPQVVDALKQSDIPPGAHLVGELVWWTPDNEQDVSRIQSIAKSNVETALEKYNEFEGHAKLTILSALTINDKDVTKTPYKDVKTQLKTIIKPSKHLDLVESHPFDEWEQVMDEAIKENGEGIVFKNIESGYVFKPEGQTEPKPKGYWYKYKGGAGKHGTDDFVVYDYERTGAGSLLLSFGQFFKGELYQVGKIDSFGRDEEEEILDAAKHMPFVIEVGFQEKTKSGKLRHQRFVRLRPDKDPKNCVLENINWVQGLKKVEAAIKRNPEEIIIEPNEWYKQGLSKQVIYSYYQKVEPKLREQFKDKDIFIVIKTDGEIYKRKEENTNIRINAPEEFEQFNTGRTIEFHITLGETTPYLFVDLDPREDFSFEEVKKVVPDIINIIKNIDNVNKTEVRFSGSKGFHLYGFLNHPMNTTEARELLKQKLQDYIDKTGRKDLFIGLTKDPKSMRLDTSTLHKTGSLRALYSLHKDTGLACVPVLNVNTFDKSMAKIENVKVASLSLKTKFTGGRFVIDKHQAFKAGLHYDLRLQWPKGSLGEYKEKREFNKTPEPQDENKNFVLRSWSIRKGIPEGSEKHLAIPTEDHPMSYISFKGDIPKGEYGGGHIDVWDEGTYNLIEEVPDKLIINFNGIKIKGRYNLIKTNHNWLIMKAKETKASLSLKKFAQVDQQTFFDFYGLSLLPEDYLQQNPEAMQLKIATLNYMKDAYISYLTERVFAEATAVFTREGEVPGHPELAHKKFVSQKSPDEKWAAWTYAIRKYVDTLSLADIVNIFQAGGEDTDYGGERWVTITQELIKLKNSFNPSDIQIIFDTIHSLEHNGEIPVFDELDWLQTALDSKATGNIQSLLPYMSTDIRDIVNEYIRSRNITGKTLSLKIYAKFDKATVQTSDLPENLKSLIKNIQKTIPKEDLYNKNDEDGWLENGLQKLFHVTILYGIKDKDFETIKEIYKKNNEIEISTDRIDYFEADDHCCAVIRCKSDDLRELHSKLKKELDVKEDYPTYKPHIAIAYLQPGKKVNESKFKEITWKAKSIEVSMSNDKLKKIKATMTIPIREQLDYQHSWNKHNDNVNEQKKKEFRYKSMSLKKNADIGLIGGPGNTDSVEDVQWGDHEVHTDLRLRRKNPPRHDRNDSQIENPEITHKFEQTGHNLSLKKQSVHGWGLSDQIVHSLINSILKEFIDEYQMSNLKTQQKTDISNWPLDDQFKIHQIAYNALIKVLKQFIPTENKPTEDDIKTLHIMSDQLNKAAWFAGYPEIWNQVIETTFPINKAVKETEVYNLPENLPEGISKNLGLKKQSKYVTRQELKAYVENQAQEVGATNNARYDGMQENPVGNPFYQFTDNITGSTILVSSLEEVPNRLKQLRESFKKAKRLSLKATVNPDILIAVFEARNSGINISDYSELAEYIKEHTGLELNKSEWKEVLREHISSYKGIIIKSYEGQPKIPYENYSHNSIIEREEPDPRVPMGPNKSVEMGGGDDVPWGGDKNKMIKKRKPMRENVIPDFNEAQGYGGGEAMSAYQRLIKFAYKVLDLRKIIQDEHN